MQHSRLIELQIQDDINQSGKFERVKLCEILHRFQEYAFHEEDNNLV